MGTINIGREFKVENKTDEDKTGVYVSSDGFNSCSKASATVGLRETLTISRWTSKSFLVPSALVNVLVYKLLFVSYSSM